MLETYIMLAALQAALAQTHLNRVYICPFVLGVKDEGPRILSG